MPAMPGYPSCGIPDEREQIGDQCGLHAEFLAHALRVSDLHSPPIHLDHPLAAHALRKILVVGPNADFLDSFVLRRETRGRRQRVIGLQLDHRPDPTPMAASASSRGWNWAQQRGLDTLARLVAGPQLIAK